MKVNFLYDMGSAQYREDGMVADRRIFGVFDGVSAPYSGAPELFDGLSGGELLVRFVENSFGACDVDTDSLMSNMKYVCEELAYMLEEKGIDVSDARQTPGTTFAVAKIFDDMIEIVQGGDCFVLVVFKDGRIEITKNHVRLHDTEMNEIILRTQREVAKEMFGIELEKAEPEQRGKIRGEMWKRFRDLLAEARRQDVNNPDSPRCYPLLNGSEVVRDLLYFHVFRREEAKTILLFSDGMVPWNAMKGMSDEEVAARVYADYKEGGLVHLLRIARGIEKKVEAVNYTDSAEATAIAIEF